MEGIIYRAYDSEGKSYVGQTVKGLEVRRKQHENSKDDNVFHKALRDKGLDAFKWEVLEDNIPEEQLLEREQYWAKVYNACGETGYSGQGIHCFPNCRCKGKTSPMKGKKLSDAHKRKISEHHVGTKGKHFSDETKRKISESHKGKKPWNTGKHFSDETKRKISESHKCKHRVYHEDGTYHYEK